MDGNAEFLRYENYHIEAINTKLNFTNETDRYIVYLQRKNITVLITNGCKKRWRDI